jgi:tyrosyl-tRNA synthetase
MKDFVEELKWRGMIHDIMPGSQELLNSEMTSGYIGFDPTADSLHIGNLVQIMILIHFQECGHKPFALVGGATGMVGDPSGKSQERNLLSEEILLHNQKCVEGQLRKFLNFESGKNAAEVVNNYDWFKSFSFLEFIRDVGKHITVSYMMAKDSVQKRLETGLSFTEFSYQLIQGYDFYWLYTNKNIKIQVGGSDQWGNIVTGTELIRRKAGGEAFAITTPLLTRSDGAKFGKSEGGNIWLDPEKTSPYKFYQYWLNVSDDDAAKFIKIFTLLTQKEIESKISKHLEAPHERYLQKELAREITMRVHSEADYDIAILASGILFGKSTTDDLAKLDERTLLSVFEGVPQAEISESDYKNVADVTELLTDTIGNIIFSSKGEARRMISDGAIYINKQKLESPTTSVDFKLLQGKYLLIQKGKKNFYLLKTSNNTK